MAAWILIPTAYLLGGLPFSLWVARSRGIDLRTQGSGNLGATNVFRVLGWRWGLFVLALDIAKGALAVALARLLSPGGGLPTLAGLAAVIGHLYTPFAGFRGGKGVATGLGVFLGLAPDAAILSFLVWCSVLAFGGWVSLASGAGAVLLPLFVLGTREDLAARFPWVLSLAVTLALMVVIRHRRNWSRLGDGSEQKIWERRRETPEGGAEPEPRKGGL